MHPRWLSSLNPCPARPMVTLLIAVGAFFGYLIAYHTYGRWLSQRIFGLDAAAPVPSRELQDDVDFVPTRKEVIFGHHFTSIAGTGPIVGPAIAVFWGWLPALLWVLLGSIFIGAVHDFGALVVSLRNRGQTVGEVAGRLINPRAKLLFLLILFLALTLVLAVFGLVIAIIFSVYPESVLPTWISLPIAIAIGLYARKKDAGLLWPSLGALAVIYGCIYLGAYYLPFDVAALRLENSPGRTEKLEETKTVAEASLSSAEKPAEIAASLRASAPSDSGEVKAAIAAVERPDANVGKALGGLVAVLDDEIANGRRLGGAASGFPNAVILWTFVLLAYCFVASVLPVWLLLQPRDYVNSHQLVLALVLLVGGVLVAGLTGAADIVDSAPAIASNIPADAPPVWPFLFITIACGACSGFHCLVSSGTTSKQISTETDAQYVGYGSMLLEGGLAVVVILACCAGVGMGKFDRGAFESGTGYAYATHAEGGAALVGRAAWQQRYNAGAEGAWSNFKLPQMVGAFVEGGANFLTSIGLPLGIAIGIIAVLVACFAATTLDSATRLQRYVIQELAGTLKVQPLTNKYAATGTAVVLSGLVAMIPASAALGPGSGGLILWPLFGATNQLLAGLAFMVTVFYLWRRNKPIAFAAVPMLFMLVMPAWAMLWSMFNAETGWWWNGKYLLFGFSLVIMGLQVWMIVEGVLLWPKVKGVMEETLPPLPATAAAAAATASGPNC